MNKKQLVEIIETAYLYNMPEELRNEYVKWNDISDYIKKAVKDLVNDEYEYTDLADTLIAKFFNKKEDEMEYEYTDLVNPYSFKNWIDAPFQLDSPDILNIKSIPHYSYDSNEVLENNEISKISYNWKDNIDDLFKDFDINKISITPGNVEENDNTTNSIIELSGPTVEENDNTTNSIIELSGPTVEENNVNDISIKDKVSESIGSSVLNLSEKDSERLLHQNEVIQKRIEGENPPSNSEYNPDNGEEEDTNKNDTTDDNKEESEVRPIDIAFMEAINNADIKKVVLPTKNKVGSTIINKYLSKINKKGITNKMVIPKRDNYDIGAKYEYVISELEKGRLVLISLLDYGTNRDEFKDMMLEDGIIDEHLVDRTIYKRVGLFREEK